MSRKQAEARGRSAETLAAWWLRLHGWRILARRVRVPAGEIDLIARRGHMVAMVEVKARASRTARDTALDAYRLRRVSAATNAVAHRYMKAGDDVRIDAILLAPWSLPVHLTNIWQP